MSGNKEKSEQSGFGTFASLRIVMGIVVVMGLLWLGSVAISFFTGTDKDKSGYKKVVEQYPLMQKADGVIEGLKSDQRVDAGRRVESTGAIDNVDGYGSRYLQGEFDVETPKSSIAVRGGDNAVKTTENMNVEQQTVRNMPRREESAPGRIMAQKVIGVAFIEALIEPLEYELESRLWGWRPNDLWISKLGMDNMENYQLGIIEMTRRSANILAERISRTGNDVTINENLEKARANLMLDPTRFWWPSAEGEYKRAIKELKVYMDQVTKGQARFYTRPDNLIPLLMEFRSRLGDCDNKLIRVESDPKTQVSTFKADDLFYYSKGVASAILPVLKAIEEDFAMTLQTREGLETLHHAIEACEGAANMSPWIVFEGNYNGVLANHRANMSTYISHARFYMEVLITTLST